MSDRMKEAVQDAIDLICALKPHKARLVLEGALLLSTGGDLCCPPSASDEASSGKQGSSAHPVAMLREECAKIVEQTITEMRLQDNRWARAGLLFAARAVRRGRHLTAAEKLENFKKAMAETDEEESGVVYEPYPGAFDTILGPEGSSVSDGSPEGVKTGTGLIEDDSAVCAAETPNSSPPQAPSQEIPPLALRAYDIANMAGSYVDMRTPEPEAEFLLKIEKEAVKLGDDLRAALSTPPSGGEHVRVPREANNALIEAMHDTRDWEAEDYTNAKLAYAMQVDRIAKALSSDPSPTREETSHG